MSFFLIQFDYSRRQIGIREGIATLLRLILFLKIVLKNQFLFPFLSKMAFGGFNDFRRQHFEKSNWKIHPNSCFKSSVENNSERCSDCEGVGHTID